MVNVIDLLSRQSDLSFYNLVKSFDDKYRIWDKAMEYNQKYKIQEKVTNVAQVAQSKAEAALQTPTGQKVNVLAHQTLAQIAAVHYEAKRIQASSSSSHSIDKVIVILTDSIE